MSYYIIPILKCIYVCPYTAKWGCVANDSDNGFIEITIVGGEEPFSFLWSNDETTQNIYDLSAGTYFLTIKDKNDCEFFGSYEVETPLFIDEGNFAEEIVLFPNPCSDRLYVSIGMNKIKKVSIYNKSYNSKVDVSYSSSVNGIEINTSDLKPGLYILELDYYGGVIARKFMVL